MGVTAYPPAASDAIQTSKILGAVTQMSVGSLVDVYTVPAASAAVVTNLSFNNSNPNDCSVFVYVRVAGAAQANKQLIRYGWRVPGRSTRTINLDIALGAGDKISVLYQFISAGAADLNVAAFGQEWTSLQSVVPKVLGQINLAAANSGTIYTVPAGKQAIVNRVLVVNPNSTSGTYFLSITPASGSPTAIYLAGVNVIAGAVTDPSPDDVVAEYPGITLGAGDALNGQSQAGVGASGLSYSAWGYEVTP
jgi:hypothetical protein